MAAKKRIATLADKYEVPGELLLKLLTEKGFEVRSTASLIGSEEFKAVKDDLLAEKGKLASRKGGIRKAYQRALQGERVRAVERLMILPENASFLLVQK